MSTVNSNIQIGKKNAAFFAANPTLVLLDGQLIYNENTGDLFIGDGTTQLSALIAINGGSGGGVWGSITGTLSSQTDLQTALNNKLDASEKSTSADQVVITNGSNVLTSLSLSANQSIRRNSGNTAFEAYTPVTTSTGAISGFIEYPSNKDYMIVVKAPYGGTITETTTRSTSGTCTATFKINTNALGGTANSVSSAEQSQLHSSSNVFAAGDDIVITISSNSACLNMSFTIAYTYSL